MNLDVAAPSLHPRLLLPCDPHCKVVAASSLPLLYACADACEVLAGNIVCPCEDGTSSHQMGDVLTSPLGDGGSERYM